MTHIAMSNNLPGISGLMKHRPDTAVPLSMLAEALLRGPLSLSRGERELIAAYTSELNGTPFCSGSHGALAAAQLDGGHELVKAVLRDPGDAPITPRLRALLRIASEVRGTVQPLAPQVVAAARAAGAGDDEIHDTVLIAAAFCMYNRYVTCLDTTVPTDSAHYTEAARRITAAGYYPGPAQASGTSPAAEARRTPPAAGA